MRQKSLSLLKMPTTVMLFRRKFVRTYTKWRLAKIIASTSQGSPCCLFPWYNFLSSCTTILIPNTSLGSIRFANDKWITCYIGIYVFISIGIIFLMTNSFLHPRSIPFLFYLWSLKSTDANNLLLHAESLVICKYELNNCPLKASPSLFVHWPES